MSQSLQIVVTGATGKQGGAVARTLLARGHRVRAYVRTPGAPAAVALAALGATLAEGDLEDRAALERAARGADGLFAVTVPWEKGTDAEITQGRAMIDAARAAGVAHVVFNSVASADRATGIPHFDSKARVEEYLRASGQAFTIVAPVYFMENAFSPWSLPALQAGTLAVALPPGRALQQVALQDIAGFVAHAFEHRAALAGKRVDIASDEVTGTAAAAVLSRVTGRPIAYAEVPLDEVRKMSEDFATMYEWFDRTGYSVDVAGLRRDYAGVGWHTFERWAKEQEWSAKEP